MHLFNKLPDICRRQLSRNWCGATRLSLNGDKFDVTTAGSWGRFDLSCPNASDDW